MQIGNPYQTNLSYWDALLNPVKAHAAATDTISYPAVDEVRAARFLGATGLLRGGDVVLWDGSDYPNDHIENVHDMHVATAASTAAFASVTEIGLAVEPLVQGPRDTSGKPAGTLARFVIPQGAQISSVLAFETKNPVQVDVSRFIGEELTRLRFRLVDQDNAEIQDLMGDSWSAVVVIHYDE